MFDPQKPHICGSGITLIKNTILLSVNANQITGSCTYRNTGKTGLCGQGGLARFQAMAGATAMISYFGSFCGRLIGEYIIKST